MKINRRKPAATTQDLLVTVARSIGATLGAVAAKVSPSPRKSHRRLSRRKRAARPNLASKSHRRTSSRASKRNGPAAGVQRRNRKKSRK
jgi:hypothetical protein